METTATTVRDGFSWHRVAELAAFYRPITNRQILCYFLFSLLATIVTLLPLEEMAQMGLFTLIWTVLPLLYYLSPIAFCKSGDSRIVERLIPASPFEKFTFRMLYFLVVMPIVIYALPEAAIRLYGLIPSIQTEGMNSFYELRMNNGAPIILINILTAVSTMLACLYTIYHVRTNRTLKGVLTVFAVQVGCGIIGAIWGFASMFRMGFEDGVSGKVRDDIAIEEIQRNPISVLVGSPYCTIMICIFGVFTALMLWLNYRDISKRNL